MVAVRAVRPKRLWLARSAGPSYASVSTITTLHSGAPGARRTMTHAQQVAGQVDDGAVEEVAVERVPHADHAAGGAQTMFWSWVGRSGPSRPMAGISDPRSQPAMTELVRPSLMAWAIGCWALAATWL